MKKLKGIVNAIKATEHKGGQEFTKQLWQFICYSPKMPVRFQQQQLLDEAQKFSLQVFDPYFSNTKLTFNGFIWGEGKLKIYLTHGWGSKAADFADLITALKTIPDVQIIAFDAPGNGSSEAELTNAPLFIDALNKVIENYGAPHVLIGHSIGTMANIRSLKDTGAIPKLLIGITPLIRLKENFEASMNAVDVPPAAQEEFLSEFNNAYGDINNLSATKVYTFNGEFKYWIAYDEFDQVAPYQYLQEFVAVHPGVETEAFNGTGHDKILKDEAMIAAVTRLVSQVTIP